ncbi:A/G-specific adenine glycosylase [Lacticaseibacillus jixiensis]|uniref:A/G-specific adenine glycosylase n=1 Tax=Lacticaseibacillus jixiensis TaxID=3231926 RepID=UPI0036F30E8B
MQWTEEKIRDFRRTLLDWYDHNRRDLPWRKDHDPYHVLVSELMLQQTQVATVIDYYQRFIAQFPTVADLAAAPEETVMKAWEGLGYYSRARNLHKAAKQLMQEYAGQWPHTAKELQQLAGIGPYTAGAIASIAFNEVEPAIDGNAFRVFARLFCVSDDIAQPKTRQVFDDLIRQVIDPKRPGDFNQAIMDLGASYMKAKDPDPAHSPVAAFDESYQTGRVLDFPVKTKKKPPVLVPYYALAIHSEAGYLFVQRPKDGMLADLWMFPLVAQADLPQVTPAAAAQAYAQVAGEVLNLQDAGLKQVVHTFTHRRWQLTILTAACAEFDVKDIGGRWVPQAQIQDLALPTVQKKLLNEVLA